MRSRIFFLIFSFFLIICPLFGIEKSANLIKSKALYIEEAFQNFLICLNHFNDQNYDRQRKNLPLVDFSEKIISLLDTTSNQIQEQLTSLKKLSRTDSAIKKNASYRNLILAGEIYLVCLKQYQLGLMAIKGSKENIFDDFRKKSNIEKVLFHSIGGKIGKAQDLLAPFLYENEDENPK